MSNSTAPPNPLSSAPAPRWQWFTFCLAAFAIAGLLQFRTGNATDYDNFYHFGHAAVYAENGLWKQDFPWATASIIRTEKADLWWGFHILLIPFTLASDPVHGMKLAAAFMLGASLIAVGAGLRNLGVRGAFVWPLLLPLTSSDEMWRLLMLRPHVISLGLMLLLVTLLVRGKNWQIFLCALAAAWVHQTVFWMVLVVASGVLLVRFRGEKRQSLLALAHVLAAVVVATFARPNPLGALRLMRVQIVELSQLRATGYPGANELQPVVPGAILLDNGPFLLLWAFSLTGLVLYFKRNRSVPASSPQLAALVTALFSLVCFELALFQASRFALYWIGFGLLAVALTAHLWWVRNESNAQKPRFPALGHLSRGGATLLVSAMMIWSWIQNGWDMQYQSLVPQRWQAASQWLEANSEPGQIVFHTDWPMFGELFFWNRHNYYIGGMDPIFQYAYDEKLFWKITNVEFNVSPNQTSGTPNFDAPEDLHTILRRDFHADFIIMPAVVHPKLYESLRRDARFALEFDRDGFAIFRVLK